MIKQDLTIREFRKEDLEAIHRLINHVVDIAYRDVYPEKALEMYRHFHCRENILNDALSGYCVVAVNDDEIIGTGTLIEDGIRRVYINPDYQKSGVGKKIYQALELKAKEKNIPRLQLGASVIARDFWERCGFTFDGEESIPAGDDKLVFYLMSKELTENSL